MGCLPEARGRDNDELRLGGSVARVDGDEIKEGARAEVCRSDDETLRQDELWRPT